MVHLDGPALGRPRPGLNPQLAQQAFEVGFVNDDFPRRISLGTGLDGAFIEGVEEAHFGDRIFFGARERAAVLRRPAIERRLQDKDFEGERRLPVDGNNVSKLTARLPVALGPVAFKKVILIHNPVGSGVALDAANSIWAGHRGIIRGKTGQVNAQADQQRIEAGAEMAKRSTTE